VVKTVTMKQVSPVGWPSVATIPLVQLKTEPGELAAKLDIYFSEDVDDLGISDGAVIELLSGIKCAFVRCRDNHVTGTAVMVEEDKDRDSVMREFLASTGLSESDVSWKPDDISWP
jgi:hypothetical protein